MLIKFICIYFYTFTSRMCHPCEKVPIVAKDPTDPIDLPENIPEDIIFIYENVFNQEVIIGHIITIDGIEYTFFLED